MDKKELEQILSGCSYERTDGFRYVTAPENSPELVDLMSKAGV